ncbi:TPA: restriction endonuclease subunit S [Proteus mirabilis]|uniref:restriction endonuclease subunit S n=1 Tax=Proteus mirabilis TaxID=584 RepID=UPI000CE01A73|nr:restriction endonuclease subunit S [Proteus mirabilis]AVB31017.1 restriction endonuclease subunit S [Proteus mirabilis]EKU7615026.1 restriction endonuclease subunit S [Proteus mirabilis]ELA7799394.1 restriction endonuclease subunit S [Proteus mirabilis]EMD5788397.1 restriction endonuclease subunit S [Proteus mirabilis]MBG2948933.1 restriction endonuclease subunit S [Proteus mirabilis]
MGSKWQQIPLGQLISLQRGHDLPTQNRVNGQIPVMGSSGLTGWHNVSKCTGPGVVIGRSGNSMGVVSYSDSDFWPLNTCLYVTDFKGNDEKYIYYMLQQIDFDKFNSGSAQKSLNRNAVYPYNVMATIDIEEQKSIGKILANFEDKITLNRQINQTLEQMAQTLFKSWFVDFDPVVDNALDAGFFEQDLGFSEELLHRVEVRKAVRESDNFKPLSEDIRRLFPNAFEECAEPALGLGGWVPKAWKVKMLGEITDELRRGISPKYIEDGGVQVINQKCIRNHEISYELTRRHNQEIRSISGRELNIGDVLVNSTGVGTLGRIAQVTSLPETTVVDSHVTVVRASDEMCPIFTFGQLMISMEKNIERLGEGSTGQTELSRKILSEQLVILPPRNIAVKAEVSFKSFSEMQTANRNQNTELTKLRDTLLPKLISGELSLSDIKIDIPEETLI